MTRELLRLTLLTNPYHNALSLLSYQPPQPTKYTNTHTHTHTHTHTYWDRPILVSMTHRDHRYSWKLGSDSLVVLMIPWISGSDDLHRSLDPLVSPGFLTLAVFLRYPFKWVLFGFPSWVIWHSGSCFSASLMPPQTRTFQRMFPLR